MKPHPGPSPAHADRLPVPPPTRRPTALLTLDVGTTACKAVLFDPTGQVLAQGQQEYPTRHPRPLWAEQDPDDWWQAAVAATRQALATLDPAATGRPLPDIVAIGLSSQRETVALLDAHGRKLGDAILWMDRRAIPQADRLAAELGRDAIHRRTGMVVDATFTLAKLLWLRENQPDLLDRATWLLQPRDYVVHWLTGALATDPSLASRTMMRDIESGSWWPAAFERVGIPMSRFPEVHPSDAAVGHLRPDAAEALGLPSGIPVVNGGGDRCCEALGAGLEPHAAMESTGTTSNLSAVAPALPARRDVRIVYTAHVLAGQWLMEQGLNTTGAILRWLRDTVFPERRQAAAAEGRDIYDEMTALAGAVPPGSEGLFLLPYFMGARAPRWEPGARGVLFGLTLEHGRGHLVRAAMEGVGLELRACAQVLRASGFDLRRVVAMGGGARSLLWLDMKAAMLGLPYELPRVGLAASLGAMVLAGKGVGLFGDPLAAAQQLNPVVRHRPPDPALARTYDELAARYEALVAALRPLYGEIYREAEAHPR